MASAAASTRRRQKARGRSRCGSTPARDREQRPWRGPKPRRASGRSSASPLAVSQRTRSGEQSLEARHAVDGSVTRPIGNGHFPRADVGPRSAAANRHEGRENVERRSGSGRGKGSVGQGTPRALRHETRPGRLSEEKAVERVRNPGDGTYRVRQTRAASRKRFASGLGSWTVLEEPEPQERRRAACMNDERDRRRRSHSVAGATPRMIARAP